MDVLTPEWVVVGKFGRPQGIKGLVRITSFTEPRDNILQYPDWSIQMPGAVWQRVTRLEERITPQHILAQIEGYTSREAVSALTNIEIAVPKETLPALNAGEYYWHELIGMRVIHNNGTTLGMVDSVLETGSNDVLVVVDNKKRRLIPYLLDDVIQKINKDSREITVCWDVDF
ncbi:MAG: ribosome maturation factor RimM [Gammaproteobacteria bacterium]|nr:ribosome maturation factor RimM [Gammaproteobacteria bacterium]